MRQAYLRTHSKCFYFKNPRFWESRDQPTPGSFPKKDPGHEFALMLATFEVNKHIKCLMTVALFVMQYDDIDLLGINIDSNLKFKKTSIGPL